MAKGYSVPTRIIANKEVCNLMFKEECLMKKFGKKLMALAMAGVLMCSSVTAFAAPTTTEETTSGASGNTTGTSTVEGYVNPDVFTVVLPVDDASAPTFNFKLDPQKLLHATQGSTYTDEDATVIFTNTKTSTSDALEVKNKGNVYVDVSVTAEVSKLDDGSGSSAYTIPLTADNTFAGDSTTSLYLGLKVGDQPEVAIDNTSKQATSSCRLEGVAEENFEITGTTGSYKKELKSGVTDFPSAAISLTGACNENADWTDATSATPQVDLTWTLTEITDFAPSAPETYTFVKGTATTIPVDLGKGTLGATKIKSVTYSATKTGTYAAIATVTNNGSSITIGSDSWSSASAGAKKYLKLVFDDATNTSAIIEVEVVEDAAPSVPTTFTFTKGTSSTITANLGAGSLAATKIKSVTYSATKTGTYAALAAVTNNDSSIIIDSSAWSGASAGDKKYLKVVFDDAAATTIIIEVTVGQ